MCSGRGGGYGARGRPSHPEKLANRVNAGSTFEDGSGGSDHVREKLSKSIEKLKQKRARDKARRARDRERRRRDRVEKVELKDRVNKLNQRVEELEAATQTERPPPLRTGEKKNKSFKASSTIQNADKDLLWCAPLLLDPRAEVCRKELESKMPPRKTYPSTRLANTIPCRTYENIKGRPTVHISCDHFVSIRSIIATIPQSLELAHLMLLREGRLPSFYDPPEPLERIKWRGRVYWQCSHL
jgi:hypothetical protein